MNLELQYFIISLISNEDASELKPTIQFTHSRGSQALEHNIMDHLK